MRRPAGRDVTSPARPDQSVDTSWAGDEREEEIRHPCVLRGRARGVPRVWILISGRGKDGEGARHARSWRPMTGDVSESLSAVGKRKGRAPSPRPGTHRGPSLAAAGTPSLFYDSPSSSPSSSYPCIYFFRYPHLTLYIKSVFNISIITIIGSSHRHIFILSNMDLFFRGESVRSSFSSIRRHARAEVQCNSNLELPSALRSDSRADVIFRLLPLSAEAAGGGRRPFASRAISGAAAIHRGSVLG